MEWKAQLEKSTASSFVQHEGPRCHKDSRYTYFYCHRSGQSCKSNASKAGTTRSLKSQGIWLVI